MKKVSLIFGIILAFILIIGSIFPVGNLIYSRSTCNNYEVTVKMVNGDKMIYQFNNLNNISFNTLSSKGSYWIVVGEDGLNIFGKKSLIGINKGDIMGGLYVINVKMN